MSRCRRPGRPCPQAWIIRTATRARRSGSAGQVGLGADRGERPPVDLRAVADVALRSSSLRHQVPSTAYRAAGVARRASRCAARAGRAAAPRAARHSAPRSASRPPTRAARASARTSASALAQPGRPAQAVTPAPASAGSTTSPAAAQLRVRPGRGVGQHDRPPRRDHHARRGGRRARAACAADSSPSTGAHTSAAPPPPRPPVRARRSAWRGGPGDRSRWPCRDRVRPARGRRPPRRGPGRRVSSSGRHAARQLAAGVAPRASARNAVRRGEQRGATASSAATQQPVRRRAATGTAQHRSGVARRPTSTAAVVGASGTVPDGEQEPAGQRGQRAVGARSPRSQVAHVREPAGDPGERSGERCCAPARGSSTAAARRRPAGAANAGSRRGAGRAAARSPARSAPAAPSPSSSAQPAHHAQRRRVERAAGQPDPRQRAVGGGVQREHPGAGVGVGSGRRRARPDH